MRLLILFMLLALNYAAPAYAETLIFPEEWKACNSDSECADNIDLSCAKDRFCVFPPYNLSFEEPLRALLAEKCPDHAVVACERIRTELKCVDAVCVDAHSKDPEIK